MATKKNTKTRIVGNKEDRLPTAGILAKRVSDNVFGVDIIKMAGTSVLCERAKASAKDQNCWTIRNGKLLWGYCSCRYKRVQYFIISAKEDVSINQIAEGLHNYLPRVFSSNPVGIMEEECASRVKIISRSSFGRSFELTSQSPSSYSAKFPKALKIEADAEEVYRALLIIRNEQCVELVDGAFLLSKAPVKALDDLAPVFAKNPLWWQKGLSMLKNNEPSIVETTNDGLLVQHVQLTPNPEIQNFRRKNPLNELPKVEAKIDTPQISQIINAIKLLLDRKETEVKRREDDEAGFDDREQYSPEFPDSVVLNDLECTAYRALLDIGRQTGHTPAQMLVTHLGKKLEMWAQCHETPLSSLKRGLESLRLKGVVESLPKGSTKPKSFIIHRIHFSKEAPQVPPSTDHRARLEQIANMLEAAARELRSLE